MRKPVTAPKRGDPAVVFRREIEAAIADGASPSSLLLKLTLTDANHLKRDPNVGVADIAFRDGTMTFLGVKIEQGGVSVSALQSA